MTVEQHQIVSDPNVLPSGCHWHVMVWKIEAEWPLGYAQIPWAAEALRRALMSRLGRTSDARSVPALISGHSGEGQLKAAHASFLPMDADFDGKLDHIVLLLPEQPTDDLRLAITGLRNLRMHNQSALLIPLYFGSQLAAPLLGTETSESWVSITPWAHPWHLKKNFGFEEQIRKELRKDGFPEPETVTFSEQCFIRGASCDVRRFPYRRPGRELVRHAVQLKFVRLQFTQPVTGPLLFGRARHFGYGLFNPFQL